MEKKKNSKAIIVVILIIALVLGCAGIFLAMQPKEEPNNNGNTKEETNGTEIDKDDNRFFTTYTLMEELTYVKERPEGATSFSGKEIMSLVALDFHDNDFTKVGDSYTITVQRVLIYLTLYFQDGAGIRADEAVDPNYVYETNTNFPEGKGMIITNYDGEKFTVKFTSLPTKEETGAKIFPRFVDSATISKDEKTITVKEKAIYVEPYESDGTITYNVYADYLRQKKLNTIVVDSKDAAGEVITAVNYADKASTITHTFQYDEKNKRFIFVKSEMS